MESTDKLRVLADACYTFNDCSDKLMVIADEIEREIAERFMELPVDADGVPIRAGDKMEREGQQFIVCAVAPAVIHSWAAGRKLGEGLTTVGYRPEDCRHCKSRTIEDVLCDLLQETSHYFPSECGEEIAKYADELRSMGVGE